MHRASAAAAALVLMFGSATSAEASSLRVAPITLKLSARAAGMLQVWNDGRAAVQVQVRVFRWTVVNGRDVLQLTQDVIASPPMTTLLPGGGNVIRVVRVAKRPIGEPEGYRLLVDELPNRASQRAGTVNVLIRHAIPVVFSQ